MPKISLPSLSLLLSQSHKVRSLVYQLQVLLLDLRSFCLEQHKQFIVGRDEVFISLALHCVSGRPLGVPSLSAIQFKLLNTMDQPSFQVAAVGLSATVSAQVTDGDRAGRIM